MKIINRMNVLEALKDLYEDRLNNTRITRDCIDCALEYCTEFNNYGFTCTRYLVECKAVLNKYKDLNFEFANNEAKEEIENTFMNLILLAYVGCKYYLDNYSDSDNKYVLIIFKYLNYLIDSFNYKVTNPDDYSLIDIEKITN